ncbi:MAG: penicillin-binding protein 2, partial [Burkholderiaceae bacterium]
MARPVRLASRNTLLSTKLPAWRSRLLMGAIALCFIALAGRAFWLQILSNDFLQQQGAVRYQRTLEIPAARGRIVDRSGEMLASSLPAKAIWTIPEDVQATREKKAEMARLLGMDMK